jgi:heme-degrading monooxygenase HmoA
MQAIAQPELSVGTFPDLGKARFYEVTIFKVKPGHEQQFEEAAKVYAAARKRADTKFGYRTYQVIAGMPGVNYLILSSVEDYGDFDQMLSASMATWNAATAEEKETLHKAGTEALLSTDSNRFRVDPHQSYVPKETREKDKEFWKSK